MCTVYFPMRRWLSVAAPLLAMLTGACTLIWPTNRPLERLEFLAADSTRKVLIVFLPGVCDSAKDFRKYGFVQAVRDRGIEADMVAVEAHVRYYGEGVIVEHLRDDIVQPARRRGYREVWLVGISLGGYGALLYARAHPNDIDRILLISPFLGSGKGGQRDPAEQLDRRKGEEDALWEWLETYSASQRERPKMFLAYGEQDKFAAINGRLAALLPGEHVERLPGRHDWPTWRRLWQGALERGWFQTGADATPPGGA